MCTFSRLRARALSIADILLASFAWNGKEGAKGAAQVAESWQKEVIIADCLAAHGIDYAYEQPLTIGNATKYPDFTIEDMESGETYYWEHCGMLHVPRYRRRWEEKLAWYRANKILPSDEGGGEHGALILTQDGANGGIDAANIDRLITEILKR